MSVHNQLYKFEDSICLEEGRKEKHGVAFMLYLYISKSSHGSKFRAFIANILFFQAPYRSGAACGIYIQPKTCISAVKCNTRSS